MSIFMNVITNIFDFTFTSTLHCTLLLAKSSEIIYQLRFYRISIERVFSYGPDLFVSKRNRLIADIIHKIFYL